MAENKGTPHYFFEYDQPGKKKPARTSWRMTLAHAAKMYPGYRPILDTVEYRTDYKWDSFKPYAEGQGTAHWVGGKPKQ